MKKILGVIGIIVVFVLGIYTNVFATGRLVDIPVPPDNHGMADFTEEEAAELDRQYKENANNTAVQENSATENEVEQINDNNTNETANEYVGKSANNYLKSLSVEGYELEPEFIRENDKYTIYVKDKNSVTSLNITAEPDDEKATIEGTGRVEITPEQKSVTIQVTAENGNFKTYKINIEDKKNEEKNVFINENSKQDGKIDTDLIIVIAIILIIIVFFIIRQIKHKLDKKSKK